MPQGYCYTCLAIVRNATSTAGNSMTGSGRPSPEPLLKKEASPAVLGGGDNSGNALEASNALNYRVWGIPAVLSTGIPGNALRAFPGSFRNFSGISSGKSQPYCPDPPILAFFDFLAFFVFRFSLLFCAFFLSFPRILGVPRREKPLLFWGKTLAFSKKARIGGSGWGCGPDRGGYFGRVTKEGQFWALWTHKPRNGLLRTLSVVFRGLRQC